MLMTMSCIVGVMLGAAAWGVSAVISGTFEPYDSGVGFLTTQIVLSLAAALAGLRHGVAASVSLVAGSWIGLNLYAYAAGGSESRAWALLGALTSLSLIVLPALSAMAGNLVRWRRSKAVTRLRA